MSPGRTKAIFVPLFGGSLGVDQGLGFGDEVGQRAGALVTVFAVPDGDGALFGFSLARVGDVTGSSADDVLVGAPEYNETTASKAGRAYLYPGGSSATA